MATQLTWTQYMEMKFGVKRKLQQSSWGATNADETLIAFNIWSDHMDHKPDENGKRWVEIQWSELGNSHAGGKERDRHIELMRAGVKTMAMVSVPVDANTPTRRVKWFVESVAYELLPEFKTNERGNLMCVLGQKTAI